METIFDNSCKKINYIYNAAGVKVKKKVTEGTVVVEVDYLAGGYQYKNTVLSFFPTAEGYVDYTVTKSGATYNYIYQYKDHLGNVRLNYAWQPPVLGQVTGQLVIKEENHYYPFGLKHGNYNVDYLEYQQIGEQVILYPVLDGTEKLAYNYKYNGKELQDELGLNMYDYGARNYNPAIGRWMNIDPLAENHHQNNPYMYANNNPVIFIDPDGRDFTLTGVAAQDFARQMQREMDEGDRTGSEVKIDANLPPDDITVNSKGIVTKVVKTDKPDRFFDQNGKQLFFNDPKNDFSIINDWRVGDQLYTPIKINELISAIVQAGFSPLGAKYTGNHSGAMFLTGYLSWGAADFGSFLREKYMTNSESSHTPQDSFTRFFRFENSKSIYNMYDAGNFIWGAWMRFNGYSLGVSRAGAHTNNLFQTIFSIGRRGGGIFDSPEDQRAITNGYNFGNY